MIPGIVASAKRAPRGDPFFQSVVSLLHFEGTSGTAVFKDVITNNWTANGNAQLSSAQKKIGNTSALFDGAGDYVIAVAPRLNLNSTDYTVEGWAYFNQTDFTGSVNGWSIWTSWLAQANARLGLRVISTGKLSFLQQGPTGSPSNDLVGTTTIPFQTWFHWAVVRHGNDLRVYLNGVLEVSLSLATRTDLPSQLQLGAFDPANAPFALWWKGYIDEVRVTKAARYSANFTPATRAFPHVPADNFDPFYDNVVSLLHFDGVDGATAVTDEKGKVWTVVDAMLDDAQSMFGGTSLSDPTGAARVITTSHADFGYGTGDFTIEFWMRPNSLSGTRIIYDQRTTLTQLRPTIYFVGNVLNYFVNGAIRITVGGILTGVWYHVAVSRVAGITRMFLDGAKVGVDYVDSTNYEASHALFGEAGDAIGGGQGFIGWVDELRVTKGVGRYAVNFDTPNAAFADELPPFDPYWPNVTLLTGFNGADAATTMSDESKSARALTRLGNAQLDQAFAKFGTASLLLDGTGDYLTTPNHADMNFLLGDFTIEAFIRRTTAGRDAIVTKYATAASGFAFDTGPSDELRLLMGTGSFIACLSGAVTVPLNTWSHVAATKEGSTLRVFIDGRLCGTLAITGTVADSATDLSIGRDPLDTTRDFSGHIDELRITKGVARYTADFTPPTYRFPRPRKDVSWASVVMLVDASKHSTPVNDPHFADVVLLIDGSK